MTSDAPEEQGLHKLVRFVGIGTTLQPAFTIGISVIIARLMGPEGRGAYGVIVTTIGILPVVLTGGLEFAARYWSARGEVDRDSLLKTTSLIALCIGIVTGAIGFASWAATTPSWLVPPGLGRAGAIALSLTLVIGSMKSFWLNHLIGQERYGYAIWGTNLATAVQLAAVAAVASFSVLTLDAATGAIVLQLLVSFFLFFVVAGREFARALRSPFLPGREIRAMARYGVWQYLSALFTQANLRGNIYLLVAFSGLHETGLYAAVLGPASFVLLLVSPFAQVITVRTARRSDDPTFPLRVASALRVVLLVSTTGAAFAAAIAPTVLVAIFGERFAAAVEPFWILLPGIVAFSITRVVASYVAGAGRPKWNTWTSAVGAALTLGLSVALIPDHGASGAALATSLAHFAVAALSLFVFLHVSGIGTRQLVTFRLSDLEPLGRVTGLSNLRRRGS